MEEILNELANICDENGDARSKVENLSPKMTHLTRLTLTPESQGLEEIFVETNSRVIGVVLDAFKHG